MNIGVNFFIKGGEMTRKLFCSILIVFLGCLLFAGCTTHNAAMTFHADLSEFAAGTERPESIKSIVVYDSWSGNTGMIAEEIADVLNCPAIMVDDAYECAISEFDLLVVGSPVHGGMPTSKIDDFLSELAPVKASAVFVTYGAPLFGSFTANRCLNSMEEKLNQTSIGRFKCNGFHKILRTYPSHPDEEDKSEAAVFAAGLLERLTVDGFRDKKLQQE